MIELPNLWMYDFEVYRFDWFVGFKNTITGERVGIWNDSDSLQEFFDNYIVDGLVSFNGQGYDKFVLAGCYNGLNNEEIKSINDYIIGGNSGYDLRLFAPTNKISQIDLMLDTRAGTSLKSFEGHYGLNIVECEIPFDYDKPLTQQQKVIVESYCWTDIDNTELLFKVRSDYLQTKINLGARCGILPYEAMTYTNAKLSARLLGARKRTYNDGREIEINPIIDLSLIPQEIIDFFLKIADTSTPDDEVLKGYTLKYEIPGCTLVLSLGGVHGSVENEHFIISADWYIENDDVASLYPSLLDLFNYISRSCSNPKSYSEIKVERLTAKAEGNKQVANDLKCPLNATSGAQDSPYNDLYDPKNTRNMRINGQLLICMCIFKLIKEVPDIKFINVNTDGFMYVCRNEYKDKVQEILDWWQELTGLQLEADHIEKVFIKDVNNLLVCKTDGKVKAVGGELSLGDEHGITNKGAFAINNNMRIVKEAIIEYLAHGVPIEDTINNCTEMIKFQQIAKVSSKYAGAMQIVDGREISVQKCNRVYATKNESYGTIYKKNKKTGNWEKVASLPEHCVIDNANELSIDDIDKDWYIAKAYEKANKFLTKGDKNMAETKPKNIYAKLLNLRKDFYDAGMKKSGVNSHAEFKYFTLDDIIPIALETFEKNKAVFVISIEKERAVGVLRSTDSDESIEIEVPAAYFSEPSKFRMNEVQAVGATVTYLRKYLYFTLFDIVENDDVEQATPKATVKVAEAPKKPATPEQRAEVKAELTNSNDNADEMLLNGLKTACGKLLEKDKEKYSVQVQKIVLMTEKFTKGTKKEIEALIKNVNKELAK